MEAIGCDRRRAALSDHIWPPVAVVRDGAKQHPQSIAHTAMILLSRGCRAESPSGECFRRGGKQEITCRLLIDCDYVTFRSGGAVRLNSSRMTLRLLRMSFRVIQLLCVVDNKSRCAGRLQMACCDLLHCCVVLRGSADA